MTRQPTDGAVLGALPSTTPAAPAPTADAGAPATSPHAPAGGAQDRLNMVFALDESQKWALGALAALFAGFALLTYVVLGLFVNTLAGPADPRLNLFLFSFLAAAPDALQPWVKVGLISLAGAMLEVMWGVGYHGFWKKDYDPETILFSAAKIVQAPFITLAALGAGTLVLPSEIEGLFLPTAPLTPLGGAMAFLLGYYSADLLDVVHRNFTKLLGKKPQELVGRPLPKVRVYPLDALVGHPALAGVLQGDHAGAVKALRAHGVETTADLLGLKEEQFAEIAREHGGDPALMRDLQGLADALARKPSLEAGAAHFRRVRGAAQGAPPAKSLDVRTADAAADDNPLLRK